MAAPSKQNFADALKPHDGPELFFGLVLPTGTDAGRVLDALTAALQLVGYKSERVRVSSLIDSVTGGQAEGLPEDQRIKHLMQEGSRLRRESGRWDIMALLAVAAIRQIRDDTNRRDATAGSFTVSTEHPADLEGALTATAVEYPVGPAPQDPADKPLPRTAYLLNSLKTPYEVETLRNIYGRAFSVISVYSSEEERLDILSAWIAKSRCSSDPSKYRQVAQELITIDREEGQPWGQRVRDTFPLADFFLKFADAADLRRSLSRFIRLVFGHPYLTPARDEYGMFLARACAMRSASLSRQVGAVIMDPAGDLIAAGCNEVPKFGGGQYWEGDIPDGRDFNKGEDASDANKMQALVEFLALLKDAGLLSGSPPEPAGLARSIFAEKGEDAIDANRVQPLVELLDLLNKTGRLRGSPPDPKELGKSILDGKEKDRFKAAQILNIIEFGRSVHAEMAAISDAARRGVSVKGATLYTTTFPCHLCACNIVSAGLRRVVYIEPYPKSKAEELFKDSIAVNPEGNSPDKLAFEPFVGVSPSKYLQLFEMTTDRKDSSGKTVDWEASPNKNPKFKRFVLSYIIIEKSVMKEVVNPFLSGFRPGADMKEGA